MFDMVRCMLLDLVYHLFIGEMLPSMLSSFKNDYHRDDTKRSSSLEVISGKVPIIQYIVVFGLPCQTWRDPQGKSLNLTHSYIMGNDEGTKY